MKRFQQFLTSPYQRSGFPGLLLIFLLLSGAIFTVFLSTKSQTLRGNAQVVDSDFKSYEELVQSGEIKPARKILEVQMGYEANHTPSVTIRSLKKKNGYVPSTLHNPDGYRAVLVDDKNTVLHEESFTIPNHIHTPPEPEKSKGIDIDLKSVNFALTLPWIESAEKLRIYTPQQILIADRAVKLSSEEHNKPEFRSIKGDSLLKQEIKKQSLFNKVKSLILKRAFAQNAGGNGKLDIVVISSGFTSQSTFETQAKNILTQVLNNVEPYKSRASQISVSYFYTTQDLGCIYTVPPDGNGSRLLICDSSKIVSAVNSSGRPWDFIYGLVNSTEYGGSGGIPVSIGYNGTYAVPMMVHEFFGHSVGRLEDEYILYGNGTLDSRVHNLDGAGDGNCYAGSPPATAWATIEPTPTYTVGCSRSNWYASTTTSIMRVLSNTALHFNRVSQLAIGRKLDVIAGQFGGNPTPTTAPTPTTSPTNTPTPTPTPASLTLSGTSIAPGEVSLTWSSYPNASLYNIWSDGAYDKGVSETTYTYTGLTPGLTHTYQVKAFRSDNTEISSSNTISVTVMAQTPLPPTLTVTPTSVVAGSSVSVSWSNVLNPTPTDWIGLYTSSADDTQYLSWINTSSCTQVPSTARSSGSCSFPIPSNLSQESYNLRLFSNDSWTKLATSNFFTVTTVQNPTPTSMPTLIPTHTPTSAVLATPSNLSATQGSNPNSPVTLRWTDNSTNETGFQIQRATNSAFTGASTIIVGANATSTTISNLSRKTIYYFRVRATNANTQSNYSNTAPVTTK